MPRKENMFIWQVVEGEWGGFGYVKKKEVN
jgi:hypothetical protein